MKRRHALLAVLLVTGCSGSANPSAPSSTAAVLQGTVTDPAGDALSVAPTVAISPDLVGANIQVTAGNLTITVSFTPGTLSQTQTVWYAELDTDQNPATGRPGIVAPVAGIFGDTDLLGVDYEIAAVYPRNSTQATIFHVTAAPPVQPTIVGTASVSFPSADSARVTVPLTLLGGTDGHMKFKVVAQQWLTDSSTTILLRGAFLDYMPDLGLPPGVVR